MTTKQKIEELEKQIAELKTECNKEIELEGGEWYVLTDGNIMCYPPSYEEFRNFGVERKTKELAERARDEMRVSNRLRARRDEIEPDWVDIHICNKVCNNAWYIFKSEDNTYGVAYNVRTRCIGTVYMSEQAAIQICEELNSGRFKL